MSKQTILSKGRCVFMYIRKSVISKLILAIGVGVLAILTILYSFTEINIPTGIYAVVWGGCIAIVTELVHKVENRYEDSSVK